MASNQFFVNGKVLFEQSRLPIDGITIELWDGQGKHGLIASTRSNVDGAFSFAINDPIASLISANTISTSYKTLRGNTVISSSTSTQDGLRIIVSENQYDSAVSDKEPIDELSYLLVNGIVTDSSGMPASNLIVKVYENGFRRQVLIGETQTDIQGRYDIKLNKRDIANTTVFSTRSIVVTVGDKENEFATSPDTALQDQNELNISFKLEEYMALSYFENLMTKIEVILDTVSFESFASGVHFNPTVIDESYGTVQMRSLPEAGEPLDGDANGELSYIARAIGHDISDLQQVVKSFQFAGEVGAGHDFMYALTRNNGIINNPLVSLKVSDVVKSIEESIVSNIIPSHTTQETDDFIAAVKAYQVESAKATVIQGEEHTIGDVLAEIFAGVSTQADMDLFLTKHNEEYEDINAFWDAFRILNASVAEKADRGLRLAAIAGFQPQMIGSLMSDTAEGIHLLAEWSEQDWQTRIETISQQAEKLCVPAAIKGDNTDEGLIMSLYAKKLKSVVQNIYPLTGMKAKLADPNVGNTLIADNGIREQVTGFIANNPNFDLRKSNIYDIHDENQELDVTGIEDFEAVQQAMAPFQRMFRIIGGNVDAAADLIVDGLDSARAISEMQPDDFVAAYALKLGGDESAIGAYSKSTYMAAASYDTFIRVYEDVIDRDVYVLGGPVRYSGGSTGGGSTPAPNTDPNLRTLFGSLSYCACEQCLSVYSPAAYYTDILNFLRQGMPSSSLPAVYRELMRRRPDLGHIDMTCKNTNTPLPYIDLVIELLEKLVLKQLAQPQFVPDSFQTSGTAKELAAHPEHVYKNVMSSSPYAWKYDRYDGYKIVYDSTTSTGPNLTTEVYPFNLPFSLPAEETRTYLKHLGFSRFELMKKMKGYLTTGITDFTIYAEQLGLTEAQAHIITGTHPDSTANPWKFYGFTGVTVSNFIDPADSSVYIPTDSWSNILTNRLDVLVQQLRIPYKLFLQFLTSDFLNKPVSGSRLITVASKDPDRPDTCDLSKLKLVFASPASPADFFNKLYRFVRLWHTKKMTVEEWDTFLRSMSITSIGFNEFITMGKAIELANRTGLKLTELTGWWTYMDIHQYVDYNSELQSKRPSVYDLLYRNKAVINPPLTDFKDIGEFTPTTIPASYLPTTYVGYTAQIAAANRVKEEELLMILNYMGITSLSTPVTLLALSVLYTFTNLCRSLGCSVMQMLDIMTINGIPLTGSLAGPFSSDAAISSRLGALGFLLTTVDKIKKSVFSIEELSYLIRNTDPDGPYSPSPVTIQHFYEKLRTDLQKLPLYPSPGLPPASAEELDALNKLKNVIYQHYSKEFGVSVESVEKVLNDINPTIPIFVDLIQVSFVSSTVDIEEGASGVPGADLYGVYRKMHKIFLISGKLQLNSEEFLYFFSNPTSVGFNFMSLEVTGTATIPLTYLQYQGLLQLNGWIELRDTLSLIDTKLVQFMKAINAPGSLDSRLLTVQNLINREAWGTMLEDLTGNHLVLSGVSTPTPLGLLNITFPTDLATSQQKTISNMWDILDIISCCLRTGLKPATLKETLRQDVTMDEAYKVLLAAKGKHSEDEWAAVAKPLRDTLRKKQRDALVGFALSHPVPTGSDIKRWRHENDLYAFLLIDVEMESCMLTSRIKQAICSVQLFVDRVLLGIEHYNYAGSVLTLSPGMTAQWEQWREWYRIWEANRKIFLYPENWIEPELRDDKSVFFEELESKLLESDVTESKVEDAMKDYLRKLDSVARLEPIGICDTQDPVTNKIITYAFARSYGDPVKYYFRILKNYQWGAWQRIEIDIKSNHVQPVVFQNKLYLLWMTFREKNIVANKGLMNYVIANWGERNKWFYHDRQIGNIDSSTDPNAAYQRQLEGTLNWIEYRDGKWKEQNTAKQKVMLNLNPFLDTMYKRLFDTGSVMPAGEKLVPNSDAERKYRFLTDFGTKPLIDFLISRIKIEVTLDIYDFFILVQYPHDFKLKANDHGDNTETIRWNGGDPQVAYNGYCGHAFLAPRGTLYKDNRYIQWENRLPSTTGGPDTVDETFYVDNQTPFVQTRYIYATQEFFTAGVPDRSSSAAVLKKAPHGLFKVFGHSPYDLQKGFFYFDDKNTYIARPIDPSAYPIASDPISLATAGVDAAVYYQYSGYRISSVFGSDIVVTNLGMGVTKSLKYLFQTFYHPQSTEFVRKLNIGGIPGLLTLQNQYKLDTMNFSGEYQPQSIVYNKYPNDLVDFDFSGTYSIYNWELFFHIPLLTAKRLSDNQQFEEARKYFHYIFDPTCSTDLSGSVTTSKQRFWRFYPFYKEAGLTITTLDDLMYQINQANAAAVAQVNLWQENPFQPHLIARMRILSYMKNVVMCYLDNLIAWADKLYRQDTIESINEATQLYILAANILGARPQEVPKRADTGPRTFNELAAIGLDAFSNALVAIEHFIDPNSGPTPSTGTTKGNPPRPMKMFYYCLPPNPKLLAYWDTIANRLFNIRHCRSIDGQVRELPLFDPPIDPAMLVRAAAAGIDASSMFDELATPPVPYKFTVMVQKANELCNDVKALGGALLSALEKKDAEGMALLRSSHEMAVLESVKNVKKAAIDEAAANIAALAGSRAVAETRYKYYSTRQYKNSRENQHLGLLDQSAAHQEIASVLQAVGSFLSILPEINLQAPMSIGPSFGGRELGAMFSGLSTIQAMKAAKKSHEATKAATEGSYERRWEEWQFQADSAQKEMAQIDKQSIAAQIRKSMAEKDLAAHEVQIANAKEMDEYMRSKYTNEQLYTWMVTQISTTYFQAYQLAYDMAKRAEKCLTYELPLLDAPAVSFIKFGYWDSLKKGLLSGEKLQYDLRKMEMAYLEANKRELELTKHISLAMLDAQKLIELRRDGICEFECPRELFNLDYPGHYMRRIKSVSISIPCVAGPYTTVAATLTQTNPMIENIGITDPPIAVPYLHSMMATSSAQNDSGMFELNFRDDRYMPFEGQGVICKWRLSLMDDENLRQFDYNTISDIILHVKYTARYDDARATARKAELNAAVTSLVGSPIDIPRYFSLKHEFANAWYAYSNDIASDANARLNLAVGSKLFPYIAQRKYVNIKQLYVMFKHKADMTGLQLEVDYPGLALPLDMTISATVPLPGVSVHYTGLLNPMAAQVAPGSEVNFRVRLKDPSIISGSQYVDINDYADDIYVVATYNLTLTP